MRDRLRDVRCEIGVDVNVVLDGLVPGGLRAGAAAESYSRDAFFDGFCGGADGAGELGDEAEVRTDVWAGDGDVWWAVEVFGRESLDAVAHCCYWVGVDVLKIG